MGPYGILSKTENGSVLLRIYISNRTNIRYKRINIFDNCILQERETGIIWNNSELTHTHPSPPNIKKHDKGEGGLENLTRHVDLETCNLESSINFKVNLKCHIISYQSPYRPVKFSKS